MKRGSQVRLVAVEAEGLAFAESSFLRAAVEFQLVMEEVVASAERAAAPRVLALPTRAAGRE